MINNVELSINLEIRGISDQNLLKMINTFTEKMSSDNGRIDFNEMDEIFFISDRKYAVTTITMPELKHDDVFEFTPKTTKIEING